MALEDIKERLTEQLQNTWAKIQESTPYQQASEKFQDLNPTMQKGVLFAGGTLAGLFLLLIPYLLFFSSSQDTVANFEGRKQMIRELYRVSRRAGSLPPVAPALSPNDLRANVQNAINQLQPPLLPEQNGGVTDFDNSAGSAMAKSLTQKGVVVTLNQLNLDQVVKLGTAFSQIRQTVKMTAMKVQARADDPHYFDVIYKLVAFNLPPEPTPKPNAKAGQKPGQKPDSK